MVKSWSSASVSTGKPPNFPSALRLHAPIAPGTTVMQPSAASVTLQILAGHIFERLPASNEVDAIADLGVAGDRADRRICEPAHQLRNRVFLEMRVGIQRH